MKIAEFANSIDQDEAAHDEQAHLDLHCLPLSLTSENMVYIDKTFFFFFEICRKIK